MLGLTFLAASTSAYAANGKANYDEVIQRMLAEGRSDLPVIVGFNERLGLTRPPEAGTHSYLVKRERGIQSADESASTAAGCVDAVTTGFSAATNTIIARAENSGAQRGEKECCY